MKIQEIRELIRLIDQSNIEEFVYEHDGTKVHMKKTTKEALVQATVQPAVEQAAKPVIEEVKPFQHQ